MMELTEKNYYSDKANQEFFSVSQFKEFAGTPAFPGCEAAALAHVKGEYMPGKNNAMLIGSYLEAALDGENARKEFEEAHEKELFTQKKTLRADFKIVDEMIEAIGDDELFAEYLDGESQQIFTGNIAGTLWKAKLDVYREGVFICDLKTTDTIYRSYWSNTLHSKIDFIRAKGYDVQGAIYQELVRQATGKRLPFYIAAISKESPPDRELIHIHNSILDDALRYVKMALPHIASIKSGKIAAARCERCEYCRRTKRVKRPISMADLWERMV